MMRFNEKSFEVRFCAALSAAIMPFNRNPQWFGMTQAHERVSGIDTMVRMGGHLLIFQFKAKRDGKFHLEKSQWRNIARINRRYSQSTYYIFSEIMDLSSAAAVPCILKHSWFCRALDLGTLFRKNAESTTLTLNMIASKLEKQRPKTSIGVKRACHTFGCFCPPMLRSQISPDGVAFFLFRSHRGGTLNPDQPVAPFPGELKGIPFGDGWWAPGGDVDPVTSAEPFERMFGDSTFPGLWGLFLPRE